MNYLFFDTETTGLPNAKLPSHHEHQPAILQLGAILSDENGNELDTINTLIQIGSKPIHPMALKAHGISATQANSQGILQEQALGIFHTMAIKSEALVCHNFEFDFNLIKIMAHTLTHTTGDDEHELKFDEISDLPYHCTMRSTIEFCNLPFPSGRKGKKFPKLEELHRILFGEEFQGAHDALSDVTATKRCFFELKHRGII